MLPQKYYLRNKIKEVSYKLIHRFYPANQLQHVNCIFSNEYEETALALSLILALYIFSYTMV